MSLKRIIPVLVLGILVVGCGPSPNQTKGTEAEQALPSNFAGPPITINVPHRIQNWPPITITKSGNQVIMSSSSSPQLRWRGRMVTLYYVPEQNVDNRGGRSFLQSTAGLQKIGTAPITAHGSWHTTWHAPDSAIRQTHIHILVQTDEGQLGLART